MADPAPPNPLTLLAPAKLNLFLSVGPPTPDGFHPLASWFVTVGLSDRLTFRPTAAYARGPGGAVTIECDDPSIPTDGRNLVARAADALLAATDAGSPRPRFAVTIEKGIPHGGGLGGGSSDAAAALVALDRLWSLGLTTGRLAAIGAAVGSDVPFFVHALHAGRPSALCQGRGEVVTPVPPPRPSAALLILPDLPVPTPAVFRRFDELHGFATESPRPVAPVAPPPGFASVAPDGWVAWPADELLARASNDLESPAFDLHPRLVALRDDAERRLGRPVRMSGSGATLFTLYDEPEQADEAAASITGAIDARVRRAPLGGTIGR